MDENNNQDEFQSALAEEFGLTPEVETPPTPPSPQAPATDTPPADPAAGEEAGATPPAGEEQVPPAGQKTEGEPANPQGDEQAPAEGAEGTQPPEEEPEQPKPMTADDIKNAVRELNQETTQRVDLVHSARTEIISKLYPAGIDKNIYDSNGEVIRTAQDIVDRGLLKADGEPYSYEEAASFMLDAGRQMAKNIEELESWAENIAEQNISLMEGNQRVMAQWGETLKAMPELAASLAEQYIKTQLKFDETGSYIVEMAMAPEQFYNIVMKPYAELNNSRVQAEAEAEAQAAAAAAQQAQSQQQERNGLPPQRGQSETKANTGDPMLDALVDELAKG